MIPIPISTGPIPINPMMMTEPQRSFMYQTDLMRNRPANSPMFPGLFGEDLEPTVELPKSTRSKNLYPVPERTELDVAEQGAAEPGQEAIMGIDPDILQAVTERVHSVKQQEIGVPSEGVPQLGAQPEVAQNEYSGMIDQAATEHGVPNQLLHKLIAAESNFNPSAVSSAGALGIAQFMPATAHALGVDPNDPSSAIPGAARYLKQLYDKFGNWKHALAAYNAGEGNVTKHGGVPPFKETQDYVAKIYQPEWDQGEAEQGGAEQPGAANTLGIDPDILEQVMGEQPQGGQPTEGQPGMFAKGLDLLGGTAETANQLVMGSVGFPLGVGAYLQSQMQQRAGEAVGLFDKSTPQQRHEKALAQQEKYQTFGGLLTEPVTKAGKASMEKINYVLEKVVTASEWFVPESVDKEKSPMLHHLLQLGAEGAIMSLAGVAGVKGVKAAKNTKIVKTIDGKLQRLAEARKAKDQARADSITAGLEAYLQKNTAEVLEVFNPERAAMIKNQHDVKVQAVKDSTLDAKAKKKELHKLENEWKKTNEQMLESLARAKEAQRGVEPTGTTDRIAEASARRQQQTAGAEGMSAFDIPKGPEAPGPTKSELSAGSRGFDTGPVRRPSFEPEPSRGPEGTVDVQQLGGKPELVTGETIPRSQYQVGPDGKVQKTVDVGAKKTFQVDEFGKPQLVENIPGEQQTWQIKSKVGEGSGGTTLYSGLDISKLFKGKKKPEIESKVTKLFKDTPDAIAKIRRDLRSRGLGETEGSVPKPTRLIEEHKKLNTGYSELEVTELYNRVGNNVGQKIPNNVREAIAALKKGSIERAEKVIADLKANKRYDKLKKKNPHLTVDSVAWEITHAEANPTASWARDRLNDYGAEYSKPRLKKNDLKLIGGGSSTTLYSGLDVSRIFEAFKPSKIKQAVKSMSTEQLEMVRTLGMQAESAREPLIQHLTKNGMSKDQARQFAKVYKAVQNDRPWFGGREVPKIPEGVRDPTELMPNEKNVNLSRDANKLRPVGEEVLYQAMSAKKPKHRLGSLGKATTPTVWMLDAFGDVPFLKDLWHKSHAIERTVEAANNSVLSKAKDLKKMFPDRKLREEAYIKMMSKEKLGRQSLIDDGLKPIDGPIQYEGLVSELNVVFKDFFDQVNSTRESLGLKPIGKVDHYLPMMAREHFLDRARKLFDADGAKQGTPNLVLDSPEMIQHRHTTSAMSETRFAHKKRWKLLDDVSLEKDPLKLMTRYGQTANKHINYSPLNSWISEFTKNTLHDPIGNKPWRMVDHNRPLHEFLTRWSNKLAGRPNVIMPDAMRFLETGAQKLNRNLTLSTLGYSLRTVVIQPGALLNTLAEHGFGNTAKAVLDTALFRDNVPIEKSNFIANRTMDANIPGLTEFMLADPLKKATMIPAKYALEAVKFVDSVAAKIAWRAAYSQYKHLGESMAIRMSDRAVARTHGSGFAGDLSPIQMNALGKSLTLWQTFNINQINWLTKDVLKLKHPERNPAQTLQKVLTYVVGAELLGSVFEDGMGVEAPLPAPGHAILDGLKNKDSGAEIALDVLFEMSEFVPMLSSGKFGSHWLGAPVDFIGKTAQTVQKDLAIVLAPSATDWAKDSARIRIFTLLGRGFGVPGAGQVSKYVKAKRRGEEGFFAVMGRYDEDAKGGGKKGGKKKVGSKSSGMKYTPTIQ